MPVSQTQLLYLLTLFIVKMAERYRWHLMYARSLLNRGSSKKKGDFILCTYKCVPFIVAAVLSIHPKAVDFGEFTFQINIDMLLKKIFLIERYCWVWLLITYYTYLPNSLSFKNVELSTLVIRFNFCHVPSTSSKNFPDA